MRIKYEFCGIIDKNVGKQTLEQIPTLGGYSTRQLSRWFDEHLDSYPVWEVRFHEMLVDGTWFLNKLCLELYRDETVKPTLLLLRDSLD